MENPMDGEYLQGFHLGDLLIEPLKGRVSGKNGERHLPPKAAEVLVCLARHAGDVVPHKELLACAWGEGSGTREALSHTIGEIRHALDDHAGNPHFLQTLPRFGYRLLVDPVAIDSPARELPTTSGQPRWWSALIRHGVIQAAAAYLVAGWGLIQVADTTFAKIGLPAWSEQLVTFAVIGGFPLVVFVAWCFEFVGGRMRQDRGQQSGRFLQGLERNYLAIFIAFGIAVVGAGLYQAMVGFAVPATTPAGPVEIETELIPVADNSVAVLRLATFDDEPTAKAFADGLSEDILDSLARVPGLFVSARGDSWSLPPHASSEIIRRRLRVDHYIEGSVRFLDDKLRVVIQFIDSATGFHRFSRDFEIDLAPTGAMQREITKLVVANLKLAVDDETLNAGSYATAAADRDAYRLFMLGREATGRPRTVENLEEAITRFDEALVIDADYPAAHAGLCGARVSLYELREEMNDIALAEAACARAMSIAPRLPVVLNSVARLYRQTDRMADAERLYGSVLDVNEQDATALMGLADIRRREQRFYDAEQLMQRAINVQPGNWQAINSLGNMYFRTGRYADASAEYRKVVFLDPDNFVALGNLAATSMMHGDFSGARDALLSATEIEENPTHVANLAISWYYTGDFAKAIETFRRAVELAPSSVGFRNGLADALWAAGRTDDALKTYAVSRDLARKQIEVTGNDVEALGYLAWAQAMLGETQAAIATIDHAVELDPGDYYTLYYQALVELRAGNRSAAIDAVGSALDAGYPVAVLAAEPIVKELWDESRFVELMARRSVGGQKQ